MKILIAHYVAKFLIERQFLGRVRKNFNVRIEFTYRTMVQYLSSPWIPLGRGEFCTDVRRLWDIHNLAVILQNGNKGSKEDRRNL